MFLYPSVEDGPTAIPARAPLTIVRAHRGHACYLVAVAVDGNAPRVADTVG